MLRVRHVVAGDEDRLRALRLVALATDPGAFGTSHEEEAARPAARWSDWAARSQDGGETRTWAAEAEDGTWRGLALARRSARPHVAELHALWVAPAARGQGVLRALCEEAAAWARERGLEILELGVLEDNAAARAAYGALGFTAQDRVRVQRGSRELVHVRMTRRA